MFSFFFRSVLRLFAVFVLCAVEPLGFVFAEKKIVAQYVVPAGKSLFLLNSNKVPVEWSTSRVSVATVENGIVCARSTGRAFIVAKREQNLKVSEEQIYSVVVNAADSVRSAAYINDNGDLKIYAATSRDVNELRVDVSFEGRNFYGVANKATESGNIKFWEIPVKVSGVKRGKFMANLFARIGNKRKRVNNITINGNFASAEELEGEKVGERTASKSVIDFIKRWEGFVPALEVDKLVPGIYNLGHGDVISFGESFYNNITPEEAFVNLVRKVNTGKCIKEVNSFLVSNKIKCTQEQFDALVSYSYNLGTGWTKGSKLKDILLDSFEPGTNVRNLSYADKEKLKEEILIKHHVLNPKRCINGLLFRRIHELNVFLYGDYYIDNSKNKYGYSIPQCIENEYYGYIGKKKD